MYDFVAMKVRYEKLSKADKAKLARVTKPEGFPMIGATYKLLPDQEKPHSGWQRVIFLLALVEHEPQGASLGTLFGVCGIKEDRIQRIIHSSVPNTLTYIASCLKLCGANNKVDFQRVAELLFYWGDKSKERLLQDYYRTIEEVKRVNSE